MSTPQVCIRVVPRTRIIVGVVVVAVVVAAVVAVAAPY